jgi:hypothetical protein
MFTSPREPPVPIRPFEGVTMPKPKSTYPAESDEVDNDDLDPLIDALLGHLPPPGAVFTDDARKLWLQVLELILRLVYLAKAKEPDAQA